MDPNTPLRTLSPGLAGHSTLSRKPSRREQFTSHEINPLLTNLSPSSTLEALATTEAVPRSNRKSFIQSSVASASISERAWGIKAAFAGKKLREWYVEVSDWSWPGYDGNRYEEKGSLVGMPARVIEEYEGRVDVIKDDMGTLEVENLKNYVRHAHLGSRARDASTSTSDYEHLGDFTAIITATIVQALPTLSRLITLLDVWTTRLTILRQVPTFLKDMANCQESMVSAWIAIGKPDVSTAKRRLHFSRKIYLDIQAVLQDQIAPLGQRMDRMLDLLEGSGDTLPEVWVDALDTVENDYSSWVVSAEELVLNNEIQGGDPESQDTQKHADLGAETLQPGGSDSPTHALERKALSEEVMNSAHTKIKDWEFGEIAEINGDGVSDVLIEHPESKTIAPEDTLLRQNPSSEISLDQGSSHHPLTLNETKSSPAPPLKSSRRPVPLVIDSHILFPSSSPSSEIGSDTSRPGSATSDYFSDKSSPEIRNASIVEYVGSPTLMRNPWSTLESTSALELPSRPSSLHVHQTSDLTTIPSQRRRASAYVPASSSADSSELSHDPSTEPRAKYHTRTRSASMQAIEVTPKIELRKIMVRRSGSYSASQSSFQLSQPKVEAIPAVPKLPLGIPTEAMPSLSHDNKEIPLGVVAVRQPETISNDPVSHVPHPVEPPLPSKASHRFEDISDLGPGSTPVKLRRKVAEPRNEAGPEASVRSPSKATSTASDDQLEARISSILSEIPAHIRLASGPEPDASGINRFSAAPRTPAMRLNRAQTSVTPPTMTLAPAQPKSSKSRSQNGEPEIKLYHLHQSGKDVPIKLFVRLVGETGERVMVRIGGGWADLAEYLKEYASHHGRRSVSDTHFDIQGFSSPLGSQASPSSRPTSPIASRPSPSVPFRRQQTTPGQYESPQTPISDPAVRSTSRIFWTDEDSPSLGLAGPKTKKVEISPKRQAWVDDMLEQARGGNGGPAVGSMGKIGGTKRVFFKSRSRAGSNVQH